MDHVAPPVENMWSRAITFSTSNWKILKKYLEILRCSENNWEVPTFHPRCQFASSQVWCPQLWLGQWCLAGLFFVVVRSVSIRLRHAILHHNYRSPVFWYQAFLNSSQLETQVLRAYALLLCNLDDVSGLPLWNALQYLECAKRPRFGLPTSPHIASAMMAMVLRLLWFIAWSASVVMKA